MSDSDLDQPIPDYDPRIKDLASGAVLSGMIRHCPACGVNAPLIAAHVFVVGEVPGLAQPHQLLWCGNCGGLVLPIDDRAFSALTVDVEGMHYAGQNTNPIAPRLLGEEE